MIACDGSKDRCNADNNHNHNEERDAEEEFQFKGIPIAGENDGDSEDSWDRASWDSEEDGEKGKDSLTNNCLTIEPRRDRDTHDEKTQASNSSRIPSTRTIHNMATNTHHCLLGES
jgi:hypothetical protein